MFCYVHFHVFFTVGEPLQAKDPENEQVKKEKDKKEYEKKEPEKKEKEKDKKSEAGPPKKKKKTEMTLKEEIELEFANGPGEPPEVGWVMSF